MDLKAPFLILLFATSALVSLSEAHLYHVGGKGGWIVNPHVRYNHWSDRTRFVVNDSLVFKYNKGGDSVLLVTKDDYYNCDTKSPIARWDNGFTVVALNRSGAFFFISGTEKHCQKGQRMIVVVLPWSPQPPISLPPESPVPKPPRASPPPRAAAPKFPPPTLSPAPTGSPSSPVAVPPSSTKHKPTAPARTPTSAPSTAPSLSPPSPSSTPTQAPEPEQTISPSPASPAPAPAQSSASASAVGHHLPWWVIAAVTILLSAMC